MKEILKVNKSICNNLKALEQEPCEDTISRRAALTTIKNLYPDMPIVDVFGTKRKWLEKYAPYFECENAIEQLPSVEQKLKTGYWIEKAPKYQNIDPPYIHYRCSECGNMHLTKTDYCDRCGVKMIEVEE